MLNIKNTFDMLKTSSTSAGGFNPLKMFRTKTALGLDISARQISLALLKRGKNGIELLAFASAPVPDGAIKNGNIENTVALAGAIKALKSKSRIRATHSAVSLFTEPVITQIMSVPKQVPSNIGQFVQDQVKHFAVLPANNIALDFRGVTGTGSGANSASRLLVVAADDRKVNDIVKVCSKASLTVDAIEPPMFAYTRALYANKIAGKFDSNVLIAVLQANILTLCVFRKQAIDFVRTKSIGKVPGTPSIEKTQPDKLCQSLADQGTPSIEKTQPDRLCQSLAEQGTPSIEKTQPDRLCQSLAEQGTPSIEKTQPDRLCQSLAEQINAVIQFYEVEVPNSSGKWNVTVVVDGELVEPLPNNAEEILKIKVTGADLQLLTGEDICRTAVASQPTRLADGQQTDKPSPVALGLAMKLLDTDARNLGVNLLPPEEVRLRAARKGSLITANIAAAVFLIMILATIWPTWKIKKLNESINYKKTNLLQNIHTLVKERTPLNKQIDVTNSKLNQINEILNSHNGIYWPGLLNDFGKAIPRTVCITSLSSGAGPGISMKGLATSNEAAYWFVHRLNKSEHINSASITETRKDNNGFINYEINCTLVSGKGKQ